MELDKETKDVLIKIEQKLYRMSSIRYTLVRGIVNGLGIVIGATIFGTLLLGFLSSVYDSFEDVPIIGPLLDETNLEESLNSGVSN